MAYLYRHIRLDKNEPFYIGIGSDLHYKRAYQTKSRNKHWHNIVSKTEYDIEILIDNITWEEACKKEVEFIKLYGRKDLNSGILTNLTDGGEGTINVIVNESTRNLIGIKSRNLIRTENHCNNISKAKKGKQFSEDHKKKLSMARKGLTAEKVHNSVLVLNATTGIFYYSINEAAKSQNVNPATLREKLRGISKINNSNFIIV